MAYVSFGSSIKTRAIQTSVVSATADTTTTSVTDVQLNTMTATPGGGTFLAVFDSSLGYTAEGQTVVFSLYVNSVQVAASSRTTAQGASSGGTFSAAQIPIAISWVADVTSGQVVEIRWRTSAGTATAHQRNLSFIKIR